jgi:hypothetical protein
MRMPVAAQRDSMLVDFDVGTDFKAVMLSRSGNSSGVDLIFAPDLTVRS